MCLLAASLKRGGECKKATVQYEDAKELYSLLAVAEEQLAHGAKAKGKRAEEVARIKVCKIERELATIYIILENYSDAAKHMIAVLQLQELTLPGGRFDAHIARTEQRIGEIYSLDKQFRRAKDHFLAGIDVLTAVFGPRHKGVAVLRRRLAAVEEIIAEGGEGEHEWAFGFDYDNDTTAAPISPGLRDSEPVKSSGGWSRDGTYERDEYDNDRDRSDKAGNSAVTDTTSVTSHSSHRKTTPKSSPRHTTPAAASASSRQSPRSLKPEPTRQPSVRGSPRPEITRQPSSKSKPEPTKKEDDFEFDFDDIDGAGF